MKKAVYTWPVALAIITFIVAILVFEFYKDSKSKQEYVITDLFCKKNMPFQYIFAFVETEVDNKGKLLNYADNLFSKTSDTLHSKSHLIFFIVYFYDIDEARDINFDDLDLPDKNKRTIRESEHKLAMIDSGYVYVAYYKNDIRRRIEKEQFSKMSFMIPKVGYKASETLIDKDFVNSVGSMKRKVNDQKIKR